MGAEMRNKLIAVVCLLSISGLGVGCGDSSESGGATSGSSAELVALERERHEILCECHDDPMYSDSLCVAARAEEYGWGECTLELLGRAEFSEYVQCMIDVQKSLNECERLAECDSSNYCYQDHENMFDSCIELVSEDDLAEGDRCPPETTFACVDGSGSVDEYLVCDLSEDCADGSDEAGCLF
jgi:hypothetical protein